MKRSFLIIAMCLVLWTCHDKDPGPDLSSATISFTWDAGTLVGVTYYAVVSDTSGNVLQWTALQEDTKVELPYPPDPTLAVLTIIQRIDGLSKITSMTTLTNVPAGDYTYKFTPYVPELPDTEYKLSISDRSKYGAFFVAVLPEVYYSLTEDEADIEKYSLGLYDRNPVTNLFISAEDLMHVDDYRYLYVPGIKGGEEKTITWEDFENNFTTMPKHVLNYPNNNLMSSTYHSLYGVTKNGYWGIYVSQWSNLDIPTTAYPEIPGLFSNYETIVLSSGQDGLYLTDIKAATPITDISILNASVDSHEEISTKRISVDMSGDGTAFYAAGSFGTSGDPLEYQVLAPLTSKVRINPPQFPQDLVDKIPNLASLKDKSFNIISADDYNMTYKDFYEFKIKSPSYIFPDFIRSKSFSVLHLGNGRVSNDPSAILKRYGKKFPLTSGAR